MNAEGEHPPLAVLTTGQKGGRELLGAAQTGSTAEQHAAPEIQLNAAPAIGIRMLLMPGLDAARSSAYTPYPVHCQLARHGAV